MTRHWRPGPVLATAGYLALVTALANASGIGYFLFPELAALASVVFANPSGSWARSPLLLALTPALTAVPGVLITRFLPYGPLAVVLDLVVCLLVIHPCQPEAPSWRLVDADLGNKPTALATKRGACLVFNRGSISQHSVSNAPWSDSPHPCCPLPSARIRSCIGGFGPSRFER
jgi:hypothetical protein